MSHHLCISATDHDVNGAPKSCTVHSLHNHTWHPCTPTGEDGGRHASGVSLALCSPGGRRTAVRLQKQKRKGQRGRKDSFYSCSPIADGKGNRGDRIIYRENHNSDN